MVAGDLVNLFMARARRQMRQASSVAVSDGADDAATSRHYEGVQDEAAVHFIEEVRGLHLPVDDLREI